MDAKRAISLERYLHTTFPDVDRVLSLDDWLTAVQEKLEEYKAWSVPHVWLVDPQTKRLYQRDQGLVEVTSLEIPELGIELLPKRIFE